MILFSNPLALLLLIPLAAMIVYIWRDGYANLNRRRRILALAARLVLMSLIVLALAGPSLRLQQSREAVVFVADRSDSVAGSASTIQNFINQAAQARSGGNNAAVVVTGRQAQVEQPPSPLGSFDGFQEVVDANYTNLEGGQELAGAIMPDGFRRRIVLMTDGQQNIGDALSAARLLHSQGVRIDVMPVRVPGGSEVLVDRVTVPSQLRPRETFALGVSVNSNVSTTSTIDVYRDNTLVASRNEKIFSGQNQFSFQQSALRPGFHTYRVHITPATDTQPNNNTGSAFTQVGGPPKVLVISDDRHKATNVLASMRTTGISTVFRTPDAVLPTLSYLQQYSAVVIVDTAADVLGPQIEAQLVPYVRDLGHGLVVIGGQESYGMGGYGGTPLEQALPVKMDLPKRRDLPSAAVVLIIESLEANVEINISKQAGKGIVDLLTQQDQIAVNDTPFDNSAGWAVTLRHASDKRAIDSAIDNMQPGDPPSYAPYLQEAYNALKKAQARVKHIIVLGDGDAEDPGYESLAKQIRAAGITISTIATNGQGFSDYQTMQDIAKWGGGRYYRADNTANIPKIFLREARTVARSGIITGKFYPQELSANPMLKDLGSVPALYGYVATTPKPTGEMVLVSKKLDPVLAGWQYGLGRSVAWTSDAAGLWTSDWLQAPGGNKFWSNLVSWTLPSSQGGQLYISASQGQGQGQVAVHVPAALGANPNVSAHIVNPDNSSSSIQLQPTAPGQYRGSFQAKGQGSYFVTVEARGAGHAQAGQAGLAVPYSDEYRLTGTNLPFLRALAKAGGGSLITNPSAAWADNLQAVYDQRSIDTWLLLLALLLLPVDIAIRRLVVTRRDLATFRDGLPFVGRRERRAEPVVAPLGSLRASRVRARSAASAVRQPAAGAAFVQPSAAKPTGAASSNRTMSKVAPSSGTGSAAEDDAGSTTGRLLAAKRRRK